MTTSLRTEEDNQSGAVSFANVDNIKLTITGPELLGVPRAPTAAANTNTTQVATTAFVGVAVANGIASGGAQPSNNTPAANTAGGTAGTSAAFSRGDHSHPGATPATNIPAANTAAGSAGSATTYARGDHAHPTGVQNITTSGYITLPGGLIMQWGTNVFTPAGSQITFPMPFPSQVFQITLGIGDDSNPPTAVASTGVPTLSGFRGHCSQTFNCQWLALGR